jgi:hypothetical protein
MDINKKLLGLEGQQTVKYLPVSSKIDKPIHKLTLKNSNKKSPELIMQIQV